MMGRADYFHRDGNAEARRSSLMNSNDKQERIKGLRNAIRHNKKHDDEFRLMIERSEEQIADWSRQIKDLTSENRRV
tara:strand:+ start:315 stop:545 length:231 start_codon:yes stop_codon:yes gene_type:complete